jgi:hypothetical protein
MKTRCLLIALALGCLVAIAGCGSGGSTHSSTTSATTTASAPPASTASSSSTTPATGLASVAPTRILAAATAALRSAKGYTMRGTITQSRQRLRLQLTTSGPTTIDLVFAIGKADAELIGLPNSSYIRGNVTFWSSQGGAGAKAARLADRWIQVPSAAASSVTKSLGSLAPATLARCLGEDHGKLSIAGRTTIGGQAAIVLRDAGNAPGSSPGLLAVAASGTPYPLRYTATGGQQAGGRVDVCNDGKANDARGSLTFSHFGHVAPIGPPANAQQTPQSPNT